MNRPPGKPKEYREIYIRGLDDRGLYYRTYIRAISSPRLASFQRLVGKFCRGLARGPLGINFRLSLKDYIAMTRESMRGEGEGEGAK